jgi:hypothetical protein
MPATNPFIASMFVRPREILARGLRPFSAWHWAAFVALDLPFLSKRPPTPDDLVLAVAVCCTQFGDDLTALDVPPGWGNEFDFVRELETFRLYLNEHCTFPDRYETVGSEGSRMSAIPSPFYCVSTVLMHMHGITEAEAWNMPLCRLVAYKEAVAESQGAELVSERDLEAWEAARNG